MLEKSLLKLVCLLYFVLWNCLIRPEIRRDVKSTICTNVIQRRLFLYWSPFIQVRRRE